MTKYYCIVSTCSNYGADVRFNDWIEASNLKQAAKKAGMKAYLWNLHDLDGDEFNFDEDYTEYENGIGEYSVDELGIEVGECEDTVRLYNHKNLFQ